MFQEIVTLIIFIAAVTYTLFQVVKLLRKPTAGNRGKDCPGGCNSCLPKKKLDLP